MESKLLGIMGNECEWCVNVFFLWVCVNINAVNASCAHPEAALQGRGRPADATGNERLGESGTPPSSGLKICRLSAVM